MFLYALSFQQKNIKGMGVYFIFGLSIRTVEIIVISVVKFFVTCLVSEILKDK